METNCNLPVEDLPFELFGLCLQEPMSLVSNLWIAIPAFIFYLKLNKSQERFTKYWALSFLFLSFSTGLGGLSHLFFQYTGMEGKMVTWVFAFTSSFFSCLAMVNTGILLEKSRKIWTGFIVLRIAILFSIALWSQNFIFVAIENAVAYIFYCLILGSYFWKKGHLSFKYLVFGVIILMPSIFIFVFNINPHIWFNKNDLSHLIIAITITFFYLSVKKFDSKQEEKQLI